MQPFARQRAPREGKRDTYISVEDRARRNGGAGEWHPQGGPPKAKPKLSEDFHFLMRCLHAYLPEPLIPTNSSASEDRFAHQYGMKFGKFAERRGYLCFVHGVQRLPKDQGF